MSMNGGGYRQSLANNMASPPMSAGQRPSSPQNVSGTGQQPSSSRSSSSNEIMHGGSSSSGFTAIGSSNNIRSSASVHSSGSSGENIQTSSSSNPLLLSSGHLNSTYMPASNSTGRLDPTSAAIARGEIGANYSRYSTTNVSGLGTPLSSASRLSTSVDGRPSSTSEDVQIELDTLPVTLGSYPIPATADVPTAGGLARSRFSEYGLGDNGSTDSHGFRDSTVFGSDAHRQSVGYYGHANKSMEDTSLLWNEKNVEADDFLHDPRTLQTARSDRFWHFPASGRGLLNALGICVLLGGILALFMGWPVHTYVVSQKGGNLWGWGLGATNSSGQVPNIAGLPSLIDIDTPEDIRTAVRTGFNGRPYELVFSDEFNVDGRTFFPGDDPFWEAVDLHYWETVDLEWYDPDAATTRDGKLEITLSEQPTHGLSFRSAMLQTWNKLCFNKGAYIEVSISLPGNSKASGFWPGAWTMGNLGRAGYGATNDGMWPYSYDSCDVGTLPAQLYANQTPIASFNGSGAPDYKGALSILHGQRASACSCKGDPHPGPNVNTGRGAPEIDIIEAQVDYHGYGTASQSIQIAPFDPKWTWNNLTTAGIEIYNNTRTTLNSWKGAATQESASAVSILDRISYNGTAYQSFGYELTPGGDPTSQITWAVGGEQTWTLKAGAFPPNAETEVGQRLISEEPMYMILNLGMSSKFQSLQFNELQFPAIMYIDYVRVWQEQGQTDISCDPPEMPTADFINEYLEYYMDANITSWPTNLWAKNSLTSAC